MDVPPAKCGSADPPFRGGWRLRAGRGRYRPRLHCSQTALVERSDYHWAFKSRHAPSSRACLQFHPTPTDVAGRSNQPDWPADPPDARLALYPPSLGSCRQAMSPTLFIPGKRRGRSSVIPSVAGKIHRVFAWDRRTGGQFLLSRVRK